MSGIIELEMINSMESNSSWVEFLCSLEHILILISIILIIALG